MEEMTNKINKLVNKYNLEKIINFTYSYIEIPKGSWKYYNETIFKEFLWIEDFSLIEESIFSLEKDFNNKIKKLKQELSEIQEYGLTKNIITPLEAQKNMIALEYIKYIQDVIFIFEKSFKNETTKFLWNWWKQYKDIENKEAKIFWLVQKEPREKETILNYLFSLLKDNLQKLNPLEVVEFMKLLKYLWFKEDNFSYINPYKTITEEYKFFNKKISREKYIKIFNFILKDIYWVKQRAIITEVSSIYDGEKFLEIPNKDTHKELTIKRILELIVHEIEAHFINTHNNEILLNGIKWKWFLEKEEWIAKFMEWMLMQNHIDKITSIPNFLSRIYAGEKLAWKEYERFLEIYLKLLWSNKKVIDALLRHKRNYPLNTKWVQHKDVVYWRWLWKVISYLKGNGGAGEDRNFSLLFLAKVWISGLDKIEKIYSALSKDEKNKIIMPIFVWEIIKYILKEREIKWNKEIDFNQMVDFISKKYNFSGIEFFDLKRIYSKKEEIKKLIQLFE